MAAPAHISRENGKKGGRPKGTKDPLTIEKEASRAKAIALVEANLIEIFTPQIAKAMQGDTQAFNAVLNRAWGTPPQYIEHTGKDGEKLFEVSDKVKQLAHDLLHRQGTVRSNPTLS